MVAAANTRRLPGIRFEGQSLPLDEVLPRMDVAVFVGFASSGPLHQPVAIEDPAQFAAIFGEDAPLAWDGQRGETVYAQLAPSVRAFFINGGRRCWVVRVAGQARANQFLIPGLIRRQANGEMVHAYSEARSEGSWSDNLGVGTALASRPVRLSQFTALDDFMLELHSPEDVVAGDLLRFSFGRDHVAMVFVNSLTPVQQQVTGHAQKSVGRPRRIPVRVRGGVALWLRVPTGKPTEMSGRAFITTSNGRRRMTKATVPDDADWKRGRPLTLHVKMMPGESPAPGSYVRAELGAELWLRVDRVVARGQRNTPEGGSVEVTGEALWHLTEAPALPDDLSVTCEKLLFELRVRRGKSDPTAISDLGFSPRHPRYWSALPSDAAFYRRSDPTLFQNPSALTDEAHASVWRAASNPRFPLAGPENADSNDLYFPVLMPPFSDEHLGRIYATGTELERDGLAQFSSGLFLDSALATTRVTDLVSKADLLRYHSPQPRTLNGIHAAFGIEEATIIAVPDASHRGWEIKAAGYELPQPSEPFAHPEWWTFLECGEREKAPHIESPLRGNFLDCDLRIIEPPAFLGTRSDNPNLLTDAKSADYAGTVTLVWTKVEEGATYIVEESISPDWSGAAQVYRGGVPTVVLYGREYGDYYYRVRAEVENVSSNWSEGVLLRVEAPDRWLLKPTKSYDATTLREVQAALLRMCAARGDLFAVLGLPEHYREEDATRHVASFMPFERAAGEITDTGNARLGYEETRALSYGALYHPWLIGREERQRTGWRRTPPDGSMAGVLAERSIVRGAWVAPANEPLRGVVALTPQVRRAYWPLLQEAQVNLIRQEPRGFLPLSADTLSRDAELRPVGVRRLLSLLRRLALRHGNTYVFEPNDDAFRRLVQRGFEAMLESMFMRGAFAGATPALAYQVTTDEVINSPQSVEQGRFIVELKVAPSLPLTFLTIRLVQAGERGMTAEEIA